MKSVDGRPDLKKIYFIVKKMFDRSTVFNYGHLDETYFTLRVFETAKTLIRKSRLRCNPEVILTASLLHDIGKIKLDTKKLFKKKDNIPSVWRQRSSEEWKKHPSLGVPIARGILEKLGHSQEFISAVTDLIEEHDCRGNPEVKKSNELKILQDADLLADYGYLGFLRPLLYSSANHEPILEALEFLKRKDNRIEHDNMLNLKVSKKIAKEQLAVQRQIVEELSIDALSDLL